MISLHGKNDIACESRVILVLNGSDIVVKVSFLAPTRSSGSGSVRVSVCVSVRPSVTFMNSSLILHSILKQSQSSLRAVLEQSWSSLGVALEQS